MSDATSQGQDRDMELYRRARVIMHEALANASPELLRLVLTDEPTEEAIGRIAWPAARALVQRTAAAQPFDGVDTAIVTAALMAAFLTHHVAVLRGFYAGVSMSR
jgi:hypothetical protein